MSRRLPSANRTATRRAAQIAVEPVPSPRFIPSLTNRSAACVPSAFFTSETSDIPRLPFASITGNVYYEAGDRTVEAASVLSQISFPDFLDQVQDGLYIVDARRTIVYWNKAAEELTGFSAAVDVGGAAWTASSWTTARSSAKASAAKRRALSRAV